MKKYVSILLSAAILSCGVFSPSVSAEELEDMQRATAEASAKEFVDQYYHSMYHIDEIDFYRLSAYEEMADYLSAKLKYQQSICSEVENFNVNTSIKETCESEDAFLLTVFSSVTFNYVGADFDSGFTAYSLVKVERGLECRILDVMIGGGVSDSLLGRDTIDMDSCYWEKEGVDKESVTQVCNYINEVIEEERIQAEKTVLDEPKAYTASTFTSSVTNAQRYRIVEYAICNTRILSPEENDGVSDEEITPVSGDPNQVPKYYDFSVYAPGNYDCTNFTSHCLLFGGAKMNIASSVKWYFNDMSHRSPAWSSVNSFYSFVTQNTGVGPKAEVGNVTASSNRQLVNCNVGDIIQIDYEGDGYYDHNVVITGCVLSNRKYWPAVTGRSGSRYSDIDKYKTSRNLALPECKSDVNINISKFRVLRLTSLT